MLTDYQQQRRGDREEQEMQGRCQAARAEERRFEMALRAWTKRRLGAINPQLTCDMFSLLAHNWYLVDLHYGLGDEAHLAKARRVKEVMDQHDRLQNLIWRRRERLVSLAIRQVDDRYGRKWTHPKLP